jgi:hypothetical protein
MAAQEAVWLTTLMADLGHSILPSLHCDSESAIKLCKNAGVYHARTKHIALRHFFLRDLFQLDSITLHPVLSHLNLADIFTKSLGATDHIRLTQALGLLKPGGVRT